MAMRSPKRQCSLNALSALESVEKEVHSFFETILVKVKERRDHLLKQLDNIRVEYFKKEESRKSHVEELEKMIRRISGITIHENLVASLKLDQQNKIRDELENFQQETSIPFPLFRAENLKPCLEQLSQIGKIELSSIYSVKEKPVTSVGKGGLDRPFGICLDQDETIYVCDCGNSKIQVFSKGGEFISEFGKGHLDRPHGIAVTGEWVFVADWELNTVSQFQKSDSKLVKRSVGAGLQRPKALALDRDNDVMVADSGNHRIAVLNSNLEFKREIGKGKLKYPCDVQVRMNKIFVIDYSKPNNVHVFSQDGEVLISMINLKLSPSLILSKNFGRHHIFLCFDKFANILISATDDKSIQIYTVEGNLLHSIKCEGSPTGIAVTDDDTIVCAMYDPSCIRFY